MSVQGAFEHFTFVSPQQWQMLHSRPRISLRDWKCLDSQFNFSNSSLALATCTFKICTFSSISCRWKSKGLFQGSCPLLLRDARRLVWKTNASVAATRCQLPNSAFPGRFVSFYGVAVNLFHLLVEIFFYNPVLLLLWHFSAFLQKKSHLNRPINWSYHRLRRDNVHECLKRVSARVASSCVLSPA